MFKFRKRNRAAKVNNTGAPDSSHNIVPCQLCRSLFYEVDMYPVVEETFYMVGEERQSWYHTRLLFCPVCHPGYDEMQETFVCFKPGVPIEKERRYFVRQAPLREVFPFGPKEKPVKVPRKKERAKKAPYLSTPRG